VCCVFAEWKIWSHLIAETAIQRNYAWSTAAIYIPYFTGNTLGSLSDIHQPQIFRNRAISCDIIASHLPKCATGTDCRDS
jgi:hypothetical protein